MYSTAFENSTPAIFFRTSRSTSLAWRSKAVWRSKNHFSRRLRSIRQHFRVSFEFPFEIVLLLIVHCFELGLVQFHKLWKAPCAHHARGRTNKVGKRLTLPPQNSQVAIVQCGLAVPSPIHLHLPTPSRWLMAGGRYKPRGGGGGIPLAELF